MRAVDGVAAIGPDRAAAIPPTLGGGWIARSASRVGWSLLANAHINRIRRPHPTSLGYRLRSATLPENGEGCCGAIVLSFRVRSAKTAAPFSCTNIRFTFQTAGEQTPKLRRPCSRKARGAPVFFPHPKGAKPPKNQGGQSADKRWCGTPHPVA
jgi:hypothetical protein